MGKTLFWIAVFFAVLLVSRFLSHKAANKRFKEEEASKTARQNPLPNSEAMVQCAHCGIHLPQSESIQSHDQYFCSQAHVHAPHDEAGD